MPLRTGVSRCHPSRGIHFLDEQQPRGYGVCGCWHLATLGCQTGLFSWHLAKSETETLNVLKIATILADSFKVCCVSFKFNTLCNAKPNWPNSCGNLLHDTASKIIIWLVGTFGFLFNFTAIVAIQRNKQKRNYKSMIKNLAIGDASLCLYLLLIAISDVIYHYCGQLWV